MTYTEEGFKFVGTQLFDGGTSSNEDQQSYQLVQISPMACT
ncbi:hypothetical protein [Acinetobacter pittii]|nr:hypothetical protein [Acinetobacter pittii]